MVNCVCVPLFDNKKMNNRNKMRVINQIKKEVVEKEKQGCRVKIIVDKQYIGYEYEDYGKDI